MSDDAVLLIQRMIQQFHKKAGDVVILGVTGQAGAGKTTMARLVERAAIPLGLACHTLPLDAFFKLSRRGRKAWLEDPTIDAQERARREDQMTWWDFELLATALDTLKAGRELRLRNVYDRTREGELVGKITINPDHAGSVVLVDGVAILDAPAVDAFLYFQAPPEVRLQRLLARDGCRTGEEARRRWGLTQRFERQYFPPRWERINVFLDNSREDPFLLPQLTPEEALRPHRELDI